MYLILPLEQQFHNLEQRFVETNKENSELKEKLGYLKRENESLGNLISLSRLCDVRDTFTCVEIAIHILLQHTNVNNNTNIFISYIVFCSC